MEEKQENIQVANNEKEILKLGKIEKNNSNDFKQSLKKRQSKHFKKLAEDPDKEIEFKLNDSIEKFQLRGEGVFFYFFYLKFFIKVFFIIGLISIASIVLNIKGGGMKS